MNQRDIELLSESYKTNVWKRIDESFEDSDVDVDGEVEVDLGGNYFLYSYKATVTLRRNEWNEGRGGVGASESMSSVDVLNVDITEVTPLDGGPENNRAVERAIRISAKDKAVGQ